MDAEPIGRFDHLPAACYHAYEALSASGVSKLLHSPAHYQVWRGEPHAQTPQMAFGTVVHALILEPDTAPPVAITPGVPKRSAADRATWAEFEAGLNGRVPLSQDDYDLARRVRDAVYGNAGARLLLDGIIAEVSLFWHDGEHDIPCKARIDALRPDGGIVDLKTTGDATPAGFARSVVKWFYCSQAAHYWNASEHVLDTSPPYFAWIAIETVPPFGSRCYVIETNALLLGRDLLERAATIYAHARHEGRWSGYPEQIEPLRLPKWALRLEAL